MSAIDGTGKPWLDGEHQMRGYDIIGSREIDSSETDSSDTDGSDGSEISRSDIGSRDIGRRVSSEAGNQAGSKALEQNRTLDAFLSGVEKRAYRMAQLATNNPDEALDIVQDAMLKLVEKYSHKGQEELGPLFYCILQSRIKDWYRRNLVRNRLRSWLGSADASDDEEDAMQQVADPAGRTPEEIVMVNGSIAALDVALRALPLRQQQVFLLRAWEGLDVRQTAAAMKCAEGSVKTHYSRALKALRLKLGEHWQ